MHRGVGGGGQDSWISPMISGFISVFPSVRSLLCPPTQLLHYRYPCSAAFTFLQPDLSVAVSSLWWGCSAARCKPEARWSTRNPCPLSQAKATPPLHPHQQSHTEQVEDAEASNIHMPGCSQPLQTCCTPKRWPTLLGQPFSHACSLSQGALLFLHVSKYSSKMLFAYLGSSWIPPNAWPAGSLLGFSFGALSLLRWPSGLKQCRLVDCAYSFLLPPIYILSCWVSIKWTSHTLLPSYIFQKRLRMLHFRKISSLIPCNASALVGWDKMSFCIFGYQYSQKGWKKEESQFSFSLRKSQEIQIKQPTYGRFEPTIPWISDSYL